MVVSTAALDISTSRLTAYTGVRADIYELVPPSAKRILDLGCSDGALGNALKAADPSRYVAGVEYSQSLADAASLRLDKVIQGDLNKAETLGPLEREQFDCVVCADVLEHLQKPEDLLKLLQPHLSPNAHLVVSLPNIRHLSAFISIFLGGSFPRRQRGIFDDSHWRWFTIRDGRRLLTDAGLSITQVTYGLRWGDKGGGLANRLLNRALSPAAGYLFPVREFLTYQFVMQARLSP